MKSSTLSESVSIIIGHNQLSELPEPSEKEIEVTRKS
ncbi:hypothetical protein ACD650_18300 [Bacillus anthracis]